MNAYQRLVKRTFDVLLAGSLLVAVGWVLPVGLLLATIDTKAFGLFRQKRIGKHGRVFTLFKIRTMRPVSGMSSTITTSDDPRVTRLGWLMRRTKVDELPQLLNVLKGDMSIVGPRPDVTGFADRVDGLDRVILSVRPGLTGPATLKFIDEEALLAASADPTECNRVIYEAKTRMNREYVLNYRFRHDLLYVIRTGRLVFKSIFNTMRKRA